MLSRLSCPWLPVRILMFLFQPSVCLLALGMHSPNREHCTWKASVEVSLLFLEQENRSNVWLPPLGFGSLLSAALPLAYIDLAFNMFNVYHAISCFVISIYCELDQKNDPAEYNPFLSSFTSPWFCNLAREVGEDSVSFEDWSL